MYYLIVLFSFFFFFFFLLLLDIKDSSKILSPNHTLSKQISTSMIELNCFNSFEKSKHLKLYKSTSDSFNLNNLINHYSMNKKIIHHWKQLPKLSFISYDYSSNTNSLYHINSDNDDDDNEYYNFINIPLLSTIPSDHLSCDQSFDQYYHKSIRTKKYSNHLSLINKVSLKNSKRKPLHEIQSINHD